VAWSTLPNGLTIAAVLDDQANEVSVRIRYEVGSGDDPPGKAGLAHLVEHLLFEQPTAPGGPTVYEQLTQAALSFNSTTRTDATTYWETGLAPQLEALIALEARRLERGCTEITPAVFEHGRAVVRDEMAEHAAAGEVAFNVAMFGADHPYGRPATDAALDGLTLADACAFITAHYAPSRATLAVAGRFNPAALPALVARWFGPIARGLARVRAPLPVRGARGEVEELRYPPLDAAVMVLVPAAPLGSDASVDDALVDYIIAQKLRARPGVVHVRRGDANRVRQRWFFMTVRDPAALDGAVAALFEIAHDLRNADTYTVSYYAARLHTQWLARYESIGDRAEACVVAHAMTGDIACGARELTALTSDRTIGVRVRAGHVDRGTSRVVRLLPGRAGAEGGSARLGQSGDVATEIHARRDNVDPAAAHQPIALARTRSSPVTDFRLANGLRVLMVGGFGLPIIDARLIFPVGLTLASTLGDDALPVAAADRLTAPTGGNSDERRTIYFAERLGAEMGWRIGGHTEFYVRGESADAGWHLWRLAALIQQGVYSSSPWHPGAVPPSELGSTALRRAHGGEAAGHDRGQGGGALGLRTRAVSRAALPARRSDGHHHWAVRPGHAARDRDRVVRAVDGRLAGGADIGGDASARAGADVDRAR